jgi:hypothetical protein
MYPRVNKWEAQQMTLVAKSHVHLAAEELHFSSCSPNKDNT